MSLIEQISYVMMRAMVYATVFQLCDGIFHCISVMWHNCCYMACDHTWQNDCFCILHIHVFSIGLHFICCQYKHRSFVKQILECDYAFTCKCDSVSLEVIATLGDSVLNVSILSDMFTVEFFTHELLIKRKYTLQAEKSSSYIQLNMRLEPKVTALLRKYHFAILRCSKHCLRYKYKCMKQNEVPYAQGIGW